MMQNKQSLLLTSDWAHKSLKRLSLSSIPISKQPRQLVTILEQLWLNSTQNKQLQQWHRWCAQIRGVRREIERPEGEERKNQKEHGDDGAAWGKRKARQSKPSRRRCICRLCQEHTASTDTIIAVDIHAHAKRNRGCSSITCATEEEELPPPPGGRCSSTPTMLLRVFSTSLRPILQTLLPLLLLLILPRRPAPPKTWNRKTSLTHEPNLKSLKQQRMHKSFLSMSSLAAVVAWAAFLFRWRPPSFSRTYPASSSSSSSSSPV